MSPQQIDDAPDDLSDDKKAAWAHGLAQYHRLAQQYDQVIGENVKLKTDLAGLKVVCEALHSQLTAAESRIASAYIVRDEAVGARAVYESLFASVQAMLRAHQVPSAPLVRDNEPAAPTNGHG